MSHQQQQQDLPSENMQSLTVSIEPHSLTSDQLAADSAAAAGGSASFIRSQPAREQDLATMAATDATAAVTETAAASEGAAGAADGDETVAVETESAAGSARIILTRLISDVQKDTEVTLSEDGQEDVASAVLGLDDEPVDERTAVARILADGAARAAAAAAAQDADDTNCADIDAAAGIDSGTAGGVGRGFTPHYVEEGPELSPAELERYNKMLLKEGDSCPACGNGRLVLRKNERISFLGCSCYPACKMRYFTSHLSAVTVMKTLESLCPDCGSPLAVKKGRYGLFIGCTSYPDCSYTYKEEDTVEDISCPSCMGGRLERRRARSGRTFYGCNSWPECDFIVPGVPVVDECPDCGFPVRYKKKVKAGTALMCANPLCASRRRRRHNIIAS